MPRSKELNQQMRDKRRESILKKSLRLFAYDGYDALMVDGIADACRCSHGLFYYYYKSREELFNAVIECYEEKFPDLIETVHSFESMHGSEGIKAFASFVHDILEKSGEPLMLARLCEVKRSAVSIDEDTRAKLKAYDIRPTLRRLVMEVQSEGRGYAVDPDVPITFFLDWFTGISYRRIRYKGDNFKVPDPELIARLFHHD